MIKSSQITKEDIKSIIHRLNQTLSDSFSHYYVEHYKFNQKKVVWNNLFDIYNSLIITLLKFNAILFFFYLKELILDEKGIEIIYFLFCFRECITNYELDAEIIEHNHKIDKIESMDSSLHSKLQKIDHKEVLSSFCKSLFESNYRVIHFIRVKLLTLIIKTEKFIPKSDFSMKDLNLLYLMIDRKYLRIKMKNDEILLFHYEYSSDGLLKLFSDFLTLRLHEKLLDLLLFTKINESLNKYFLKQYTQNKDLSLNAYALRECLINRFQCDRLGETDEIHVFLNMEYSKEPSNVLFDCLSLSLTRDTLLYHKWDDLKAMFFRRDEILSRSSNTSISHMKEMNMLIRSLKYHPEYTQCLKSTLESIQIEKFHLFFINEEKEIDFLRESIFKGSNHDQIIDSISDLIEKVSNIKYSIFEYSRNNEIEINFELKLIIIRLYMVDVQLPSSILPTLITLYPDQMIDYCISHCTKMNCRDLMRCIYQMEDSNKFNHLILKIYEKLYKNTDKSSKTIIPLLNDILLSSLNMKSSLIDTLIEISSFNLELFFLVVYDYERRDYYIKKRCLEVINEVIKRISEYEFNRKVEKKQSHLHIAQSKVIENDIQSGFCKKTRKIKKLKLYYVILSKALPGIIENAITSNDKTLKEYCLECTKNVNLNKLENETVLSLFNCLWNEITHIAINFDHERIRNYQIEKNPNVFRFESDYQKTQDSLIMIKQIVLSFMNILSADFILKYLLVGLEHPRKKVKRGYCLIYSWIEGSIIGGLE